MKKIMIAALLTIGVSVTVSAANWNEEPPQNPSFEDLESRNPKVIDQNDAQNEIWYRYYNQFGGWDYYCYRGKCCFIGNETQDTGDGYPTTCRGSSATKSATSQSSATPKKPVTKEDIAAGVMGAILNHAFK